MSITGHLYKIDEVLERYCFSRATLYRLINAREFPSPVKVGRSSRWLESALEEYEKRIEGKGWR